MAIGAIEIQLLADLSRLKADMDKAGGIVGSATQGMQRAADAAKGALAGMLAGLSVGAISAFVKQGIDAADAMNEISQKTGLAIKDVAGVQLAFKQGGVSAETMTSGLAKMAKQMVEGTEVCDKMGVKTRNADGSLRSVKDVLIDTAKSFEGMEGGAVKTNRAMDVFGKTGADMIPVLNGGAKGFLEMAEMADKLGLTIDESTAKAADQFNDQLELLGMGSKGVATQLAAQLLPTLSSLSASFLESMTSGDALRKAADFLATALKGVYSAGVIGVEVFNTVGKVIGGVAGAILSVASGEFRQAKTILEETGRDVTKGWKSSADTISRAWTDSGNAAVQSMAASQPKIKAQAELTKAAADAAKKHADEQKKLAEAGAQLVVKVEDEIRALDRRLDLGRDLTKAEADYIKIEEQVRAGRVKLTDEQLRQIRALLDARDARAKQIATEQEYIKTLAAVSAHTSKQTDAESAATEKVRDSVIALREQIDTAGLNERQLAERKAAVDENRASDLEWQAAMHGGNWQLEEQSRLLRDRAKLTRDGVVVKEAIAARDEWQKTTDSIGQGLTDSLYRAFESGKGFFKTLWDGIKNVFKTTILKMAVNVVMNPVNAALGGLLGGFGGMANAGSAAGGIGGALGTAGSIFGAGGLLGSIMGGAGWMTGATTLGGALGAAGSLIGTGTAGGVMAGLGMGLGALGPIGLGLGLLASVFGGKSTPHLGGTVSADAAGVRQIAGASMGWNDQHISNDTVNALSGISAGVAQALNGLSQTFGGAGGFGVNAGFAADNKDPSWGYLQILKNGQSLSGWSGTGDVWGRRDYAAAGDVGYQQYLADVAVAAKAALDTIEMPAWAQEMVAALGSNPSLEMLAQAAEAIAAKKAADESTSAVMQEDAAQAQIDASDTLSRTYDAINAMSDRINAALDNLRQSIEAGQTAIASATSGAERVLRSWDDAGACTTRAAV